MTILRACSTSLTALAAASLLVSAAPTVADPAAPAAAAAPAAGVPGWGIRSADLPANPDVRFGRLPNGMRYAIKRHQGPQGQVSVRLGISRGQMNETDAQRGAAHFVEHMAFNGSTNIPEGKLLPMLERLGLSFGADTNAETGFDHTTYQLDLPNTKAETVDAALLMLREVAGRLTLAPAAVDRERGILISEASVRNDPNRRRLANVLATQLPGNRLPVGINVDPATIKTIRAADLREFYRANYRPELATLVIVGDVDPAEMERKLTARFSDWKGVGKAGPDYRGPVVQGAAPVIGTFTDPAIAEIVQFSRARAYSPAANSLEEERQKTLEVIVGAILSNRFQPLAQAPNSPVFGAQYLREELARNATTSGLFVIARDGRWAEAVALGEQELRRALQFGFTASEVDEIKANILSGLTNAAAQDAARKNADVAEGLISQSNENTVPTSAQFDLALYQKIAPSITPDSVTAALRAVWQDGPTLVHVSSKKPIANPQTAIAGLLDQSRKVAVTAPVSAITKAFAYDSFGTPGTVVADKTIADLGVRTVTFSNGVQLNLKRTTWEPGKVAFAMDVGSGASAFPADRPGLGLMTGMVMAADGFAAHDATELRRLLAGHQVSLGLSAGQDALSATGAVSAKDLDLQLKLLAARLSASGFRDETATQWAAAAQTGGKALAAQPIQTWLLAHNYVLTGGDARMGLPSPAALSALSLGDLKAALAPQLASGPVALSLVGDFDEAAVIAAVGKTLGALPARAPRRHQAFAGRPLAFKATGTTRITHTGQADQGVISLSWPTTDDRDLKDTLTRDLLAEVMGIKATELVREKLGATYSPKGLSYTQFVYPGYGHLTLLATAGPDGMDRIDQAFRQIAAELRDRPITPDLLARAREPVLGAYARSAVQNDGWVALLTNAQAWPERLDRRRQREAVLRSITPADVQAAARRYLIDARAAAIRVVPAAPATPRS